MTPTRDPRRVRLDAQLLLEAAQRAGCAAAATVSPIVIDGQRYDVIEVNCAGDNEQAMRLLAEMANAYQHDPQVGAIAHTLRARAATRMAFADRIHRYVKGAVSYMPEEVETFRSPLLTLRLGAGDCDDQALLVCCLARAGGMPAVIEAVRKPSDGMICHACARVQIDDGSWCWLETTIDALLGESPLDAARRLGVSGRADLR